MTNRPNLVFILSDQQRYDTMRCYGNEWIQTPNLNHMASQCFIFRNAYVTQPVCTPARASIMTGLYPHTAGPVVNKLPLSPGIRTIAEMVSDDYLCAYFGKWHLGDDVVPQHGFDKWISVEDERRDTYTREEYRHRFSDYHHHLIDSGFKPKSEVFDANHRSELPQEFQMASFLGDQASRFIRETKDQPFILYVSTFEPHSPNNGPFNDMYSPLTMPVGPAFLRRPKGGAMINRIKADYFLKPMLEGKGQGMDSYMSTYAAAYNDVSSEEGWRILRARYFANITLVDQMVGKITAALDNVGLADKTVTIFSSEHGDMMGDHGLLEKRSFYEESSRVPLIMRIPWISTGENAISGSVSHIDLVPTLLDLLGEPIPTHLQGESLLPVLKSTDTLSNNDVFIEWNGVSPQIGDRDFGHPAINRLNMLPWRSVVSNRWKLNLCAGDQSELFNLDYDPYELTNLFNDPGQRARIRDLTARIRLWQYTTSDEAPLPSV